MAKKFDKNELFEIVLGELKEIAAAEKCDVEYFEKMMRHHKIKKDIFGGVPYLDIYKMIAPHARQTDEYYELVIYLDVIVDLIYYPLMLVDDIMDHSELRLQKPCWYTVVGVGAAANDSHIAIAATFIVLKKHFSHLDCYIKIVELVSHSLFIIGLGQHFDDFLASATYDNFTEENYALLLRNKSSCTIAILIESIMYLAGYSDAETIKRAKDFFYELGFVAQVQNDFWDCYAYMGSNEKSGTDIQERKCSWLSVQCLKRATPEQKEIFSANYGKKDPECVTKIKELYDEMKLSDVYRNFIQEGSLRLSEQKPIDTENISSLFHRRMISTFFGTDYSNGKYRR